MKIIKEENGMVKAWIDHVSMEEDTKQQLLNTSKLPFIHKYVAAMPDCHLGAGACVGSVIPTIGAIVPSAVGVDIGCGMIAQKTTLKACDLPDNLLNLRSLIESSIPHGTPSKIHSKKGSWEECPIFINNVYWEYLFKQLEKIDNLNFRLNFKDPSKQIGTLGGGNHFIEICLDENNYVWIMIHSGSRSVGNFIGRHFIELAKRDMEKYFIHLPDKDLSYIPEGSEHFKDYINYLNWAQLYAKCNRDAMLSIVFKCFRSFFEFEDNDFIGNESAINCHHNYVNKEHHNNKNIWITRKGAISARKDELGIIPGSMGAKSYIVKGLGNEESFCSASHGAGRVMSRTQAKKLYSVEDLKKSTEGVECRKDIDVIDEIPMAYKNIDDVMESQKDLVEIVRTLKQVLCIKG